MSVAEIRSLSVNRRPPLAERYVCNFLRRWGRTRGEKMPQSPPAWVAGLLLSATGKPPINNRLRHFLGVENQVQVRRQEAVMSLTWFVSLIAVLAAVSLPLLVMAERVAQYLRRPGRGWLMVNEREEFAPVQDWLDWWQEGAQSK